MKSAITWTLVALAAAAIPNRTDARILNLFHLSAAPTTQLQGQARHELDHAWLSLASPVPVSRKIIAPIELY